MEISEEELEEANMKLGHSSSSSSTYIPQVLNPKTLKEIVMKIYFEPK
jgi:hypothetical protein